MNTSRGERQLMRQRGAGNRAIETIDFGFSFPSQSRRRSHTPPVTRSTPRANATPLSTAQNRSLQAGQKIGYSNSSKRRRVSDRLLTDDSNAILSEIQAPAVNQVQARQHERAGISIDDQEPHRTEQGTVSNPEQTPRFSQAVPRPDPLQTEDKENERLDLSYATSKLHDKTRNTGEKEVRNLDESASSGPVSEAGLLNDSEPSLEVESSNNGGELTFQIEDNAHVTVDGSREMGITLRPETIAKPTRKRKKRKSVILGPRKRRSVEGSGRDSVVDGVDEGFINEPVQEIGQSVEAADNIPHVEERSSIIVSDHIASSSPVVAPKAKSNRSFGRRDRLSVSASPAVRIVDDEEEDETYVQDDVSPEPTTPAIKKKRSQANTRASKANKKQRISKATSRTSKDNNESFSITTYRLTNSEALPTIVEEPGEQDPEEGVHPISSDDEIQNPLPPTFTDRSQPNAIDVLAQVCRETIQTTIENLSTDGNIMRDIDSSNTSVPKPLSRADLKKQQMALTRFDDVLAARLFDMSTAIDYRATLESRLRQSKRTKTDLQHQWMNLRRQRDELGLEADDIRRRNWEGEEERKTKWEVSQLAETIEMLMERGENGDCEDEGEAIDNDLGSLEFDLRRVADIVSLTGGHEGGILGRVKAFNSQLERMAGMLEQ